jgi:hypothetical protein
MQVSILDSSVTCSVSDENEVEREQYRNYGMVTTVWGAKHVYIAKRIITLLLIK